MDTRWGQLIAVLTLVFMVGCESIREINPRTVQRSSQNEEGNRLPPLPEPTITSSPTPTITPTLTPTPTPTPTQTPTPDPNVSIFDFKGNSNGQPLPTDATGNGYIRVAFPSHSVVSTPLDRTKIGAVARCEYWLYDDQNQLVLHVLDTMGGFHPNFFDPSADAYTQSPGFAWFRDWVKQFVPFKGFNTARDRGNNHMDAYFTHYVVEGRYRWVFKNLGNTIQLLRAGLIRAGNAEDQVNENLNPGETVTHELEIHRGSDPFDSFKLNTNNYTP